MKTREEVWSEDDGICAGLSIVDRQTILRARIVLARAYAQRDNHQASFLMWCLLWKPVDSWSLADQEPVRGGHETMIDSRALRDWRSLELEVNGHAFTGQNGLRDPDAPCEMFETGEPASRGGCATDGHYLCEECVFIAAPELRRRREQCESCGTELVHGPWSGREPDFCPRCNE